MYSGNTEIMKLLIENGANVNLIDTAGETPLTYAIHCNNLEATNLLIENGANMNLIDGSGWLPLNVAIFAKKYPNKLGRIAPEIFWFADRFEKELMLKTAYVLFLLQKD